MTIRAIQTRYKGYNFRSRLEARWAVFFDALGMKWEYEPEGFELRDGQRYLPDFWLSEYGLWLEVKPAISPSEIEMHKAHELVLGSGRPVFITQGDPENSGVICYSYTQLGGEYNFLHAKAKVMFLKRLPNEYWRTDGDFHRQVFLGGMQDYEAHVTDHSHLPKGSNSIYFEGCSDLDAITAVEPSAVASFRSARFEHGQSGATL